jgi:hypothetical protein
MITCTHCDGRKESLVMACGPKGGYHGMMACSTCKGTGEITEAHGERIKQGKLMREERIERRVVVREEAKRLGVDLGAWSRIEQGGEPQADAERNALALRLEELAQLPPKVEPTGPKCFCGVVMTAIGRGRFPYPCIASKEHPNAMVYQAIRCGHSGWKYQDDEQEAA